MGEEVKRNENKGMGNGWTYMQLELARKIGLDRTTIVKWETEKSMPRAETLQKLAECLGCTVDELLKKEGRNED